MDTFLDQLTDFRDNGEVTPCHSNPNKWLSNRPTDRETAANGCYDCPLMLACADYATRIGATDGIWGGIDRGHVDRSDPYRAFTSDDLNYIATAASKGKRPITVAEELNLDVQRVKNHFKNHYPTGTFRPPYTDAVVTMRDKGRMTWTSIAQALEITERKVRSAYVAASNRGEAGGNVHGGKRFSSGKAREHAA